MIAIIPARRGSKSIPGKNHRDIAGRPLVAWVIDAGQKSVLLDEVVVATDDRVVAEIAEGYGVSVFERSPDSATDTAATEAVLREVLDGRDAAECMLLQATSPLTTTDDIDAAINQFRAGGYDSMLSVAEQTRFLWRDSPDGAAAVNYDPRARPRRQEATPLLVENGALYIFKREIFQRENSRLGGKTGLYRMGPETYFEVDEPEDWAIVASVLRRRQRRHRCAKIKLVLSDVDGVLTDNGMYWSSDGVESKRISARDGKGFELLHKHGVKTALITSESVELVTRRGAKLGCHRVVLGSRDKVRDADAIRAELGLEWEEVAFIGDDIHDLGLLRRVGSPYVPVDAVSELRAEDVHVLSTPGGRGCFRELADLIVSGATKAS